LVNNIILNGMAWAASLRSSIVQTLKSEGGQDLLEYAVLAGAIAIVAAAALFATDWLDFDNFKSQIQDCLNFNSTDVCNGD